jgi:hypothetical protein
MAIFQGYMAIKTKPFFSAYPKPVVCIFADTGNAVIDEGGGISYLISEDFTGISIVSIKPIVGTEPHKALPVLVYAGDGVIGNTLFNTQVIHRYILLGKQLITYQQAAAVQEQQHACFI